MACYCFLRNVSELQKTGFSACQSRFLREFIRLLVPFGAEVECKPSSPNGLVKLHRVGFKTLHGIFVGYDQRAAEIGVVTA